MGAIGSIAFGKWFDTGVAAVVVALPSQDKAVLMLVRWYIPRAPLNVFAGDFPMYERYWTASARQYHPSGMFELIFNAQDDELRRQLIDCEAIEQAGASRLAESLFTAATGLFCRGFELGCSEHEVHAVSVLVALEAIIEIDPFVYPSVSQERLIFPFAIAFARRVLASPAGPLLHHSEGLEFCLDEAPISVLHGIATSIELHVVASERNHRSARKRLILAYSGKSGWCYVEFPKFLCIHEVVGGVHHAPGVICWKGHFVAARAHGRDREE
jgi:hypothetical protein